MRPRIDATGFGSITIEGIRYTHDVYIDARGRVSKRKKKLSKRLYGTSHQISVDEIDHILEDGAHSLLIGTGQYGRAELSAPAREQVERLGMHVVLQPTPEAIQTWNESEQFSLGLFHVTC